MTNPSAFVLVVLLALPLAACVTEPGPDVATVYGQVTAPPKPKKLRAAKQKSIATEMATPAES